MATLGPGDEGAVAPNIYQPMTSPESIEAFLVQNWRYISNSLSHPPQSSTASYSPGKGSYTDRPGQLL